ncbi:MAG: nucleotide exchange factor GrpE [Hyphomicrobiaceae bacterium]
MTHDNKVPGGDGPEATPTQPAAPGQPNTAPKPFVYPDTPEEIAADVAATAAVPASAEVLALKVEVAELKDRILRTHAEMDNMRKRLEKEKSDASKYAISKFARDIVGIGDVFEKAIASAPTDAAEATPALKSFVEGVTMTERELINVLERHGVKRIDPKGQLFNPHHHQAVMEQPNPDVPSGTVTQVFQPGYMIDDRVLRPAMVVVARGGFKPVVRPAEGVPTPPIANDQEPKDGTGTGGGTAG